jgi:hypothetical protein
VRLWPALAALVVGAGIILGALVAHWREVARPRLIEELRLGQGLELLRGLTGPDLPDVVVRAAARHIRQVEDRMELRRLTDGIALPDADVLLAEARLLAEAGDALARINADPRLAAQLGGQVAALTGLIAAETMDAAAVRTALEALISARQALPEATTKGVAPEAATGVPGLPVSALLPPVGTAPSTLRRLVRRMDWRTELALLVLAGLAAIPVWGASPTWGGGVRRGAGLPGRSGRAHRGADRGGAGLRPRGRLRPDGAGHGPARGRRSRGPGRPGRSATARRRHPATNRRSPGPRPVA